MGRGTQVVRERSAKPLYVGSIPTRASNFYCDYHEIPRCARDFGCGLPLRSRPQTGSSSIPTRASNYSNCDSDCCLVQPVSLKSTLHKGYLEKLSGFPAKSADLGCRSQEDAVPSV